MKGRTVIVMTKLTELEIKVAKKCEKYEKDCAKCPINNACNLYSRARTEEEKIAALKKMLT